MGDATLVSMVRSNLTENNPWELLQVRYFLAVASILNFTRAAEQCNITQHWLTKGVQKLSQELGGQLVYREVC